MLPEWAPNPHPLIVHFPIALLVVAVLSDLLALALRRRTWLLSASTGLYVLGALAAVVAFLSGRDAASGLLLPAAASPVLTEHADWAQWTAWFFGVLALARLVAVWRGWMKRQSVQLVLLLAGTGGLFLLYQTGDHGAQLVYQYGAGVSAVPGRGMEPHDHALHGGADESETRRHGEEEESSGAEEREAHSSLERAPAAADLSRKEDGSWSWEIGPGSERTLEREFEWISGSWEDLGPVPARRAEKGGVLELHPRGESIIFVTGIPIGNLQVDLRIDPSRFEGETAIVHHFRDPANYHFLSLGTGGVRLGKVEDGKRILLDEAALESKGWTEVRLVSDKTHFRGYVGREMVVHGHGPEPSPGRVGLLVEGSGTLLLSRLQTQVLP